MQTNTLSHALLLAALPLLLTQCTTLERSMAGKIGCPSDDIEILDTDPGFGVMSTTMTAQCHGRKFICSLGPDFDHSTQVANMSCAPSLSSLDTHSEDLGNPRNQSFDEFVGDLNKAEEL